MAIFLCFFLIICSVLGDVTCIASAEESLQMYAGSYALADGNTGRVLVGKKCEEPMANASTTKIMTCIVALEQCDLDEEVVISAKAAAQPKVHMGLEEGERYSLEELLYGLMLESYNDCAVAIAEHVGGSVENFMKILNEKAVEIGCQDTHFVTPNGLDGEDEGGVHHTTAADLCRMMGYCTWESAASTQYLAITQTRQYKGFVNRNSFLDQMEGVLTGKTGFTNKAGYCYVAAFEQDGERYTIALLACGWPNNRNYKWSDARTLLEYGLDNYDVKRVRIKAYTDAYKLKKHIELSVFAPELCYEFLMKEGEEVRVIAEFEKDFTLPAQNGSVIGKCQVYIGEEQMDEYDIVISEKDYILGLKNVFYTIFYQILIFSL